MVYDHDYYDMPPPPEPSFSVFKEAIIACMAGFVVRKEKAQILFIDCQAIVFDLKRQPVPIAALIT